VIPSPKLDDRTYADLVAEAMRLIPRYCPEWTDHNPADPGITILELTAWMTELILYRLNRVPEKNYLAFLDMIGIRLRSPQPARGLISFDLVEGAPGQVVRAGTQVATQQASEEDTVIFETQRDLVVVPAPLDRCFSYFNETYADNSPFLAGGRPEGFEVFAGADRIDRFLYLGDPRFQSVNDVAVLRIHLTCPDHGGRDLARLLEWEYWNGRRWRELKLLPVEVERGEVVFVGPDDLSPTVVHGVEDRWIRGRLAEVPQNPWETEVDTCKAIIEVVGEGVMPDTAFANLDGGVFLALDLHKNVHPLGASPKIDQCVYLASRELFAQPEAEVRIEIALSDPAIIPPARASEDLLLSWEYFDGKKWRVLGRSGPKGTRKVGDNDWGFIDSTNAFTQSGVVSFRVPKDMHAGEVNGEDNYWIRARVEMGDYGLPGSYMLDGDKWVWRDDRPLRPPSLKSVAIKYRADLQGTKRVLSYNDFRYRDHSEEAKVEYRPFQPFSAVPDQGAALYLGWNGKLPNDPMSVYLLLAEAAPKTAPEDRANAEWLKGWYADRDAAWEAEQRVIWEYFDGTNWTQLVVVDGTKNFTQSGFVDFVGPDDAQKTLKFTEDRWWIRARLEMGGYVRPPRIQRVLTNSVEAANVVTIRDEVLGSSDGTPIQSFSLSQGPLLEGEVIEVRERDEPSNDDLQDLGTDAVRRDGDEGVWVRWKAVESFFDSGPRARHYVRNPLSGRIQFGDGTRGMMPPAGRNNVIARRYQVGGGVRGNVNAMTLTQLTRAIAYIDKCYNALPAAGGADAETVDEAKARAPLTLKSRDRAVTAEDFESLALRASTGVARAKCLPSQKHDGEVQVVVVPRGDEKNVDLTKRLQPAPELLRVVKNHLDERRLVGTVVEVLKPTYVEISIKVTLVRRTVGQTDRLKREIEDKLRRYLHPLVGGRDGKGWPFGRSVYKSDLAHLVEEVPGVEVIDSITLFDEDQRVAVENARLPPGGLVYLVNVAVVERVREEIV
jgi:predicted phage baseplate assembly protein